MKTLSIALVALASLCLAGCPEEKAAPTPDNASAKPTQSATPAAAPAATTAKPAEGGW